MLVPGGISFQKKLVSKKFSVAIPVPITLQVPISHFDKNVYLPYSKLNDNLKIVKDRYDLFSNTLEKLGYSSS